MPARHLWDSILHAGDCLRVLVFLSQYFLFAEDVRMSDHVRSMKARENEIQVYRSRTNRQKMEEKKSLTNATVKR